MTISSIIDFAQVLTEAERYRPAAEKILKGEPDQAACEDRCADEETELRFAETEILLYLDTDDREDRPDGEADREGYSGEPERAALVAG